MKKILILLTGGLVFVVGYFVFFQTPNINGKGLVSPVKGLFQVNPSQLPVASPNIKTPVSFEFNEQTDLKAELEKVNPNVEDQDFSQP